MIKRKPMVAISVGNDGGMTDVSEKVVSCTFVDDAGIDADSFELELSNTDGATIVPGHGAMVNLMMGWAGSAVAMGRFEVDACGERMPPRRVFVRGCAARWLQALKEPTERTWKDTTVGEIISEIAAKHGFTPRVEDRFYNIDIDHLVQTESDMHLVTCLSQKYGAIGKPDSEFLLFVKRYQGFDSTGASVSLGIDFQKTELLDCEFEMAARGSYKGVTTFFFDRDSGERVKVDVGGQPRFTLLYREFGNFDEAARAAGAKLDELKHQPMRLTFLIPGRTELVAGAKLTLTNHPFPDANREWKLNQVIHMVNKGTGYRSFVEAESPNGGRHG